PRDPAGHQAQDGDRVVAGPAPPQGPPGPRPAHPDERPHPQGSQEDGCRQEEGEEVTPMAKPKSAGGRRPRRRERKNIGHGIAHIKSSFNNTLITFTDLQGNVVSWASAGNVGFKGSRKSTPYAAQTAAEAAARRAIDHGVRKVDV